MSHPETMGRTCTHLGEELVSWSRMVVVGMKGSGQNLEIFRVLSGKTNRIWRWSGHKEGEPGRTLV